MLGFDLETRTFSRNQLLFSTVLSAGCVLAVKVAGFLQVLDIPLFDTFMRLRSTSELDDRIILVDIREADVRQFKHWPLPNPVLTQAIRTIHQGQPRAIGLDLYQDLQTDSNNSVLQQAFQDIPQLIGAAKVVGERIAPPGIDPDRLGAIDLILDQDGKVRRSLLSVRPPGEATQLSFALKLSLLYLRHEGFTLQPINPKLSTFHLGSANLHPLSTNFGGYVGADTGGYQIPLVYREPLDAFPVVSFGDLLNGKVDPNIFRDRVVLIGTTAQRFSDFFETPYSTRLSRSPRYMSGLLIHAHMISQLLSAALDQKPLFWSFPEAGEAVWVVAFALLGAQSSALWLSRSSLRRFRAQILGVGLLTLGSGVIALTLGYGMFNAGIWLPVAALPFAFGGAALSITFIHAHALQQNRDDLRTILETTLIHSEEVERVLTQKTQDTVYESYLRSIQFLDAMPVGVMVFEADDQLYYANQRAQELLGEETCTDGGATPCGFPQRYQIYRAATNELYPPEQLPSARALQGESVSVRDLEIRQDDRTIPVESWGTPIYNSKGEIQYALVAFQDITVQKRAWEERAKFVRELEAKNIALEEMDRLKDEFLKRTTHELRTPLNGIIGSLQIILDDLCDDRTEELDLLQQAHQSALHLLEIVNDILDFNRIKSGKLILDIREVDLHACLTQALYLQLANLRQKKLRLVKQYAPDQVMVLADPTRLKQVIINMIGNAIKFTDAGSITICTKIEPYTNTQGQTVLMAIVSVKDTGIGVDPSLQSKLFEAFVMEDGSSTRRYGGSGLGLTISRSLIQLMGGEIELTSPGKGLGTEVIIRMPLAKVNGETPIISLSAEAPLTEPEVSSTIDNHSSPIVNPPSNNITVNNAK